MTKFDLTQVPDKLLTLPQDVAAAEKKLEEATYYRDLKKAFIDTKEAGILLREKAKNPRIPEYHLKAIATEELHFERLELIEDESVVKQAHIDLKLIENRLMSARQLARVVEKEA